MYGYHDHESKSGKFLRSTAGGLSYYATLAAIPLVTVFAIAHNAMPDMNETGTPDSRAALTEYTAEGNRLTALLEDSKTLKEAALNQSSADAVLEMKKEAATREAEVQTLGEVFANSILTDSRLTERDYNSLLANLTIDETDYAPLPQLPQALDEARAAAANAEGDQSAAIRAHMNDTIDSLNTRAGFIGGILMISFFGGIIFGASGAAREVREELSYKLDDMAKKRIKPKH